MVLLWTEEAGFELALEGCVKLTRWEQGRVQEEAHPAPLPLQSSSQGLEETHPHQ